MEHPVDYSDAIVLQFLGEEHTKQWFGLFWDATKMVSTFRAFRVSFAYLIKTPDDETVIRNLKPGLITSAKGTEMWEMGRNGPFHSFFTLRDLCAMNDKELDEYYDVIQQQNNEDHLDQIRNHIRQLRTMIHQELWNAVWLQGCQDQ